MDGGKFKSRLSEVNARAMSRRQNELVCKFKMVAGNMVSIRGQVMEYTYIPTGIKRKMVRSGVDCHWKGQIVGTVGRGPVAIHSSGQTISNTKKYHVFAPMGRFQLELIYLYFPPSSHLVYYFCICWC